MSEPKAKNGFRTFIWQLRDGAAASGRLGNELLIFGGVGAIVGAWCSAHRNGQLRGIVRGPGADCSVMLPRGNLL